jgi:AbrB family looped-hinge helix DNA binding protein
LEEEIDMSDSILSSKYQIVIPKDIREVAGVKPGDAFDVIYLDGTISLVRVPSVDQLFGMLPGIDTQIVREEDRSL